MAHSGAQSTLSAKIIDAKVTKSSRHTYSTTNPSKVCLL